MCLTWIIIFFICWSLRPFFDSYNSIRSHSDGIYTLWFCITCTASVNTVSAWILIFTVFYRRSGLFLRNLYGPGSGQIWLVNLYCTGTELSLDECTHNGWGVHNCDHSRDVSIICDNSKYSTFINDWSSV